MTDTSGKGSLIVTSTHNVNDCADCDALQATLTRATTETCARIANVACVAFAQRVKAFPVSVADARIAARQDAQVTR